MLTAIRELAEEAERRGTRPRPAVRSTIVARGDDALARTPEMLPVLQEAGVVDAGAAGLVEIVRGVRRRRRRRGAAGAPPEHGTRAVGLDAIHQELSRFRYCTVFVVEGERPRRRRARARARAARRLAARRRRPDGAQGARAHRRPGRALSLGVARGTIGGVEIANMHAQTARARGAPAACRARTPSSTLAPGSSPSRRAPATARSSRASARSRGRRRPDDEPVDRRPPRRDRGDAGDGGARAAEQRQRDPGRRAGGRRWRRSRCASSRRARCRPGSPRWSRSIRRLPAEENEAAMLEALVAGRDRRGDDRVARRPAQRRRGAQGRVARASPTASRSRRRRASTRSRARSSSACSRAARGADAPHRRRPTALDELLVGDLEERIPSSSSTCTTAASPTTRCCWRPSSRGGGHDARFASCSSRTTTSSARRSSCSSGCARRSRSSAPSPTATTAVAAACREHDPDVVLMDYRMPGLDGAEATVAVRAAAPAHRRRLPHRRARAARELAEAARGGGRGRLRDEGSRTSTSSSTRSRRAEAARIVNLTAENTAIVLDSTADFPEAPERFPNLRVVPLYVRSATRASATTSSIDPHDVLRAAARPPPSCRPRRSRHRGTSSRSTRSSRAATSASSRSSISSTLSGTFASAAGRRRGGRRQGARDRHGDRLGRDSRCSRSASSAGSSAARPTRRSTRSSSATGRRPACSSRSTRSSTSRRAAASDAPPRSRATC